MTIQAAYLILFLVISNIFWYICFIYNVAKEQGLNPPLHFILFPLFNIITSYIILALFACVSIFLTKGI